MNRIDENSGFAFQNLFIEIRDTVNDRRNCGRLAFGRRGRSTKSVASTKSCVDQSIVSGGSGQSSDEQIVRNNSYSAAVTCRFEQIQAAHARINCSLSCGVACSN